MAKRSKQQEAKLVRAREKMTDMDRVLQLLDELETLNDELTPAKIIEIAPRVTVITSEIHRLMKKHEDKSDTAVDLEQTLQNLFEPYRNIYKLEREMKQELERYVKLEVRRQMRETNTVEAMPDKLCVKCQKRVQKVNEFCKRCAREEGIIVHGKV